MRLGESRGPISPIGPYKGSHPLAEAAKDGAPRVNADYLAPFDGAQDRRVKRAKGKGGLGLGYGTAALRFSGQEAVPS